jgi:hypothetical protein
MYSAHIRRLESSSDLTRWFLMFPIACLCSAICSANEKSALRAGGSGPIRFVDLTRDRLSVRHGGGDGFANCCRLDTIRSFWHTIQFWENSVPVGNPF